MIINIRIADPDNKRARNSLHNWLNNNQYIKENAQLKLPDSAPEGMGPEFDVIQLVLSSGFDLANLALAFAEWRDKSRETAAPIAVQANGRTTELSLDDMADSGDEAYVVRRALAGAPDPAAVELRRHRRERLRETSGTARRPGESRAAS